MNGLLEALGALFPPLAVAILFVVAIRAIVHADRRERDAQALEEAGENALPEDDLPAR